jgi:uncharacterized metal-binding protein YceD (DUF177 family)
MCSLESLKIDLKGLKERVSTFAYDLSDSYFEAIEAPEVRRGDVHVELTVTKVNNFFELNFHVEGTVKIPCDICLDDMDQGVVADSCLTARFGELDSADDEVVTVAEDEGILDVAWLIYELIALAIPIKHVHAPGKCNPAMIQALEEHSADRSSDEESTKPIDPRWAELLKLKK